MDELLFSDLDLAFAEFLAARSGLAGRKREQLRRLVAELSHGLMEGHSCLPLTPGDESWLGALPLVGDGTEATPLVLWRSRLYLHRYFHYERELANDIGRLARTVLEPAQQGGDGGHQQGVHPGRDQAQQRAVAVARRHALTIICGGPGTGKTTTVVSILAGLLEAGEGVRLPTVALAAPTGKAATRLGEAVARSLGTLQLPEAVRRAIPGRAATLHRLLGVRRGSSRFVHNRENPLGYDIVVVDEASMVDLALMGKLLASIKPGARLILLGDKDQLASVESGAVLADLVDQLPGNTVELTTTYRFEQGIKGLAEAIKKGDGKEAWRLLQAGEVESVRLLGPDQLGLLGHRYGEIFATWQGAAARDPLRVLAAFNGFRVLCALHHGPRGVVAVNRQVETALAERGFAVRPGSWYPGRPVLITRNDYGLGLYNGDIGVCLPHPESGELRVWFEPAEGGPRSFAPSRLPECQTVYAMTIHKSQGSEFEEVAVILPGEDSRVLGRELLYTAITRAKQRVAVLASEEILALAVARSIARFGGLGEWLGEVAGKEPRKRHGRGVGG